MREYETLQSIISGWGMSKDNHFEMRQSARGVTTSAKVNCFPWSGFERSQLIWNIRLSQPLLLCMAHGYCTKQRKANGQKGGLKPGADMSSCPKMEKLVYFPTLIYLYLIKATGKR